MPLQISIATIIIWTIHVIDLRPDFISLCQEVDLGKVFILLLMAGSFRNYFADRQYNVNINIIFWESG